MSPTVATSIGFVVAALILLWACIEIGGRYLRRRKKLDARMLDTWVPLKPTDINTPEDSIPDAEEDDQDEVFRAHKRAKQNGHHSERKRIL